MEMKKNTKRLVTDADAAEVCRVFAGKDSLPTSTNLILALLDTREALIEALTNIEGIVAWDHMHVSYPGRPAPRIGEAEPGDCLRCDVLREAEMVLSRLRDDEEENDG